MRTRGSVAVLLALVALVAPVPSPPASADDAAPDVHASGTARFHGDASGLDLVEPVVAIAATATGEGYWIVGSDGDVVAFGDAELRGSAGAVDLWAPIVGMAATPSGEGYWLVASDGGVFTYGDARFFGSAGAVDLWAPIVGMAATPSGEGYWMVAADGGVFSYGDARFHGSAGDLALVAPVVGMAATPSGEGYWMVAADGGVFSYGDAAFHGSGVSDHADLDSAVGVAALSSGGYLIAGFDGSVVRYRRDARPVGVSEPVERFVARSIAAHPLSDGWWVTGRTFVDEVVVWQSRGLRPATRDGAIAAARAAGAQWTVTHGGDVDLVGAVRGAEPVLELAPGWRLSLSARALDPAAHAAFVGPAIATVLAAGDVVVGSLTADRLGLSVGDVVTMIGWDGASSNRRVGAIGTPAQVGETELTFSVADAATFGFVRETAVRIWDFSSRTAIESAAEREVSGEYVAVDVSWRDSGRDAVLSTARLKDELGEFEFQPSGSSSIVQEPAWYDANIVAADLPIVGVIRCHRRIVPDLVGALGELEQRGLSQLIDVGDTRRNGGCHNPRRIRGESGGSLSRHSWGGAIDVNPSSNPAGVPSRMDMRVVDVFRRWGFAWGGTWVLPDGHHFEWVGRQDGADRPISET